MGGNAENTISNGEKRFLWIIVSALVGVLGIFGAGLYAITWTSTQAQVAENAKCIADIQIEQATTRESIKRIDKNVETILNKMDKENK